MVAMFARAAQLDASKLEPALKWLQRKEPGRPARSLGGRVVLTPIEGTRSWTLYLGIGPFSGILELA